MVPWTPRARQAARARAFIFLGTLLLLSRTGASGAESRHHRRWPLEERSKAERLAAVGLGVEQGEHWTGREEAADGDEEGAGTIAGEAARSSPTMVRTRITRSTARNSAATAAAAAARVGAVENDGTFASDPRHDQKAATAGKHRSTQGSDSGSTDTAVTSDSGETAAGDGGSGGSGGSGGIGGADADTEAEAAMALATGAGETKGTPEEDGGGSGAPVPDHLNADGTLMFPADLTGTFKGKWTLVPAMGKDGAANGTTGARLPGMKAFLGEDGSGTVVLQLHSTWDPKKNMQWVQGEVALRDGSYITDSDLHLHMAGSTQCVASRPSLSPHLLNPSPSFVPLVCHTPHFLSSFFRSPTTPDRSFMVRLQEYPHCVEACTNDRHTAPRMSSWSHDMRRDP